MSYRNALILAALVLGAAPAAAQDDPARAAVESAVAALQQEVAAMQSPDDLRAESDYFKTGDGEADAGDVTPEIVVEALNSRLHQAPAVDAYLKYQLLSGVPDKFPDELARPAVQAYQNAPAPIPQPGMDPQERQQMQRLIQGLDQAGAKRADTEFQTYAEQQTQGNEQIVAYRDALYAKLPVSGPMLAAGLQDIYERSNAGIRSNNLVRLVISDAKAWAVGGAPRGDVAEVARQMMQLEEYDAPQYVDGVEFKKGAAEFSTNRAHAATKDTLAQAAQELEVLSRDAGAGTLQLK